MTLYGEGEKVFGERPTRLAFTVTSFCLILLAAQFTTLCLTLADSAFAYAHQWGGDWAIYAPFADTFHHGLFSVPPLGESYRLLVPMAATLALIIPAVLVYLWPAEESFSSLLAVHSFALTLITFGALALAFEPRMFEQLALHTSVKPIIWSVLLALVALRGILGVERKTLELTTNVFSLNSPLQRISWWLFRIFPAFSVLAIIGYLNGYLPWTYAALSALVITLLESLGRIPKQKFHHLKSPHLRESAAVLPIVASAVVAGSIYLFGMEAIGQPQKVITHSRARGITHEMLSAAHQRAGTASVTKGDSTKPGEGPIIDIRWSKPRKNTK